MKIKFPKINDSDVFIDNKTSIVLIGANGSGKTRMSSWIEFNNIELNIHRISAQKSLNMPISSRPSELQTCEEQFLFGVSNDNKQWLRNQGKLNSRWGNNPETHMLNDFDKLMEFLATEEYEKSIEYRFKHKSGDLSFTNNTRLEIIKEIWENVIPNKKLIISAGKIETYNTTFEDEKYNGAEMSDGERAIFYFIGEVLCVPDNTLIIIDEPENHLHKSILIRLWNAIEAAKSSCCFIYITHDLDFASSRNNSQTIWVKNMPHKNQWDYELVDENFSSDSLKLEILGNRQKILLVEGTPQKSIDRKLYSLLFDEYNVIPLESCSRVISFTKAYKQLNYLHYDDVKGIVDRDRRTNDEITNLNSNSIFCPNVTEIENLFLLPEIIKIVAILQNQESNYETILTKVKEKTFEFLIREIETQALLFTKQRVQNNINQVINKKSETLEEYKHNISEISQLANIDNTYSEICIELKNIIDTKDYYEALKIINNKGLLPYTELTNIFGWKKDYYINYVLNLLNSSDETSKELHTVFKQYIPIE